MYKTKAALYSIDPARSSDIFMISLHAADTPSIAPCIGVWFKCGEGYARVKYIPDVFALDFLERNATDIGVALSKTIRNAYLEVRREVEASNKPKLSMLDVLKYVETQKNGNSLVFNSSLVDDSSYFSMRIDYDKLSDAEKIIFNKLLNGHPIDEEIMTFLGDRRLPLFIDQYGPVLEASGNRILGEEFIDPPLRKAYQNYECLQIDKDRKEISFRIATVKDKMSTYLLSKKTAKEMQKAYDLFWEHMRESSSPAAINPMTGETVNVPVKMISGYREGQFGYEERYKIVLTDEDLKLPEGATHCQQSMLDEIDHRPVLEAKERIPLKYAAKDSLVDLGEMKLHMGHIYGDSIEGIRNVAKALTLISQSRSELIRDMYQKYYDKYLANPESGYRIYSVSGCQGFNVAHTNKLVPCFTYFTPIEFAAESTLITSLGVEEMAVALVNEMSHIFINMNGPFREKWDLVRLEKSIKIELARLEHLSDQYVGVEIDMIPAPVRPYAAAFSDLNVLPILYPDTCMYLEEHVATAVETLFKYPGSPLAHQTIAQFSEHLKGTCRDNVSLQANDELINRKAYEREAAEARQLLESKHWTPVQLSNIKRFGIPTLPPLFENRLLTRLSESPTPIKNLTLDQVRLISNNSNRVINFLYVLTDSDFIVTPFFADEVLPYDQSKIDAGEPGDYGIVRDSTTKQPIGMKLRIRHPMLAKGQPVVAAGEFHMRNGKLFCDDHNPIFGINDASGSYGPNSVDSPHLKKLITHAFRRYGFTPDEIRYYGIPSWQVADGFVAKVIHRDPNGCIADANQDVFELEIKEIQPIKLGETTYRYMVGKMIYAESLKGAKLASDSLKSLPAHKRELLWWDVKDGLFVCFMDRDKVSNDALASCDFDDSIQKALRDGQIKIPGRQLNQQCPLDGYVIEVAARCFNPAKTIMLFNHEFEHHLWMRSGHLLRKHHENLFEKYDPTYMSGLMKKYVKAYLDDLKQYLKDNGYQSVRNIPQYVNNQLNPAYYVFRSPVRLYGVPIFKRKLKQLCRESGVEFSEKHFEEMIQVAEQRWLDESGPVHYVVSELQKQYPTIKSMDIKEAVSRANLFARGEIPAHLKDAGSMDPVLTKKITPRLSVIHDQLTTLRDARLEKYLLHRRASIANDSMMSEPLPAANNYRRDPSDVMARLDDSRFPLFKNVKFNDMENFLVPIKPLSVEDIRNWERPLLLPKPKKFKFVLLPDRGLILSEKWSAPIPLSAQERDLFRNSHQGTLKKVTFEGRDLLQFRTKINDKPALIILNEQGHPEFKKLALRHPDLSARQPVLAAGDFHVQNGKIIYSDNWTGHFLVRGPHMRDIVERAFVNAGFAEARGSFYDRGAVEGGKTNLKPDIIYPSSSAQTSRFTTNEVENSTNVTSSPPAPQVTHQPIQPASALPAVPMLPVFSANAAGISSSLAPVSQASLRNSYNGVRLPVVPVYQGIAPVDVTFTIQGSPQRYRIFIQANYTVNANGTINVMNYRMVSHYQLSNGQAAIGYTPPRAPSHAWINTVRIAGALVGFGFDTANAYQSSPTPDLTTAMYDGGTRSVARAGMYSVLYRINPWLAAAVGFAHTASALVPYETSADVTREVQRLTRNEYLGLDDLEAYQGVYFLQRLREYVFMPLERQFARLGGAVTRIPSVQDSINASRPTVEAGAHLVRPVWNAIRAGVNALSLENLWVDAPRNNNNQNSAPRSGSSYLQLPPLPSFDVLPLPPTDRLLGPVVTNFESGIRSNNLDSSGQTVDPNAIPVGTQFGSIAAMERPREQNRPASAESSATDQPQFDRDAVAELLNQQSQPTNMIATGSGLGLFTSMPVESGSPLLTTTGLSSVNQQIREHSAVSQAVFNSPGSLTLFRLANASVQIGSLPSGSTPPNLPNFTPVEKIPDLPVPTIVVPMDWNSVNLSDIPSWPKRDAGILPDWIGESVITATMTGFKVTTGSLPLTWPVALAAGAFLIAVNIVTSILNRAEASKQRRRERNTGRVSKQCGYVKNDYDKACDMVDKAVDCLQRYSNAIDPVQKAALFTELQQSIKDAKDLNVEYERINKDRMSDKKEHVGHHRIRHRTRNYCADNHYLFGDNLTVLSQLDDVMISGLSIDELQARLRIETQPNKTALLNYVINVKEDARHVEQIIALGAKKNQIASAINALLREQKYDEAISLVQSSAALNENEMKLFVGQINDYKDGKVQRDKQIAQYEAIKQSQDDVNQKLSMHDYEGALEITRNSLMSDDEKKAIESSIKDLRENYIKRQIKLGFKSRVQATSLANSVLSVIKTMAPPPKYSTPVSTTEEMLSMSQTDWGVSFNPSNHSSPGPGKTGVKKSISLDALKGRLNVLSALPDDDNQDEITFSKLKAR